ncbi:MAG: hypothetical protein VKI83_08525 [Synechococcaceae cyanobacterium]|nr:hypothetical protein [Synechococcaceae cyanobacterium]
MPSPLRPAPAPGTPAGAASPTPGRTTRRRLLGLALVLAAAFSPRPAQALIWQWGFSREADAAGAAVQAGGLLVSSDFPDAEGFHPITALSGSRNGVAIEALLPGGSAIPGNCLTATDCFLSDNRLRRDSGEGHGQLTSHGFGVRFVDGTYANVFHASFLSPARDLEYFSAPPFGLIPPAAEDSELDGRFQAAPLAVPGPLPLGGALLALHWAGRLRRRLQR